MQKIRYEVDPFNRLVIYGTGKKGLGLPRFRKVLDGEFRTDEFNTLSYNVKAPFSERENISHQVRLKGSWSLTDNYDLRFTLDKSGRETFGDQLTLQGEILRVNENSILFAITTRTKEGGQSTYVLDLAGSWKADRSNRLSFHVKREEGTSDILTFKGAWDIGDDHQIVYRYRKAGLAKKKKASQELVFKGHWDMTGDARLSYLLGADTSSSFDFRISAGLFKENRIKYELGVGVKGRNRPVSRAIILFGRWELRKDTGLVFEVDYGDGRAHGMIFGADVKLTDRDTLLIRLKRGAENNDIGAKLELSHQILKNGGEAFLRFLRSGQELAVYAGAVWMW